MSASPKPEDWANRMHPDDLELLNKERTWHTQVYHIHHHALINIRKTKEEIEYKVVFCEGKGISAEEIQPLRDKLKQLRSLELACLRVIKNES